MPLQTFFNVTEHGSVDHKRCLHVMCYEVFEKTEDLLLHKHLFSHSYDIMGNPEAEKSLFYDKNQEIIPIREPM